MKPELNASFPVRLGVSLLHEAPKLRLIQRVSTMCGMEGKVADGFSTAWKLAKLLGRTMRHIKHILPACGQHCSSLQRTLGCEAANLRCGPFTSAALSV